MKKKKIFSLVLLPIIAVLILVGCGAKTVKTQMVLEEENNISTITLYSKQDEIVKTTSEFKIYYSGLAALNISNKEEAKKYFDKFKEDEKKIKGIQNKVTYKKDYVLQETTIDYTVVDKSELTTLSPIYDENTVTSLETTISNLEKAGYEEN